jgi:hypothetical protein
MSSFRFLHAGGFALDQPLTGLAEVPEPLEELFIDAPYAAAKGVFDAAIEEHVDFVILTGDLLDLSRPTPRALAFLIESLERLSTHNIPVYWSAGRLDQPRDWPPGAQLPACVHVFPTQQPEELSFLRGDRPTANLVGRSWHGTAAIQVGEFKSDADGLPTIVAAYGQADVERFANQLVDYWALGGQPQRQTLGAGQRVIHYAGTPQGRSPAEGGPHGCTLVDVSGDRAIRSQFIRTDAITWHAERLTIEPNATLSAARAMLADRAKQLSEDAQSRPLIVSWHIGGGQHLAGPAARRDLAAEWQDWLRKEFFLVAKKPTLWSRAVELDEPQLPSAWFDEESMLGDFLRNLKELTALDPSAIDLSGSISEHHRTAQLADLAQWSDEEHRDVLLEAALTGAQLLGAGDREP